MNAYEIRVVTREGCSLFFVPFLNRTYGAERTHVWLCPISKFLVFI